MASLEELEDLDRIADKDGDASMADAKPEDDIDPEILSASTADINIRKKLLENEIRMMRGEYSRLHHEKSTMIEKIKENKDKIENNRYVVAFAGLPEVGVEGDMLGGAC